VTRVRAICVGRANPLRVGEPDRESFVLSGIVKEAVSTLENPTPIDLFALGFAGDEQADLSVHGGHHRAVYAYPLEHYAAWQTMRMQATGRDDCLPWGSLGENLTLEGLLETEIWIGDTLTIGSGRHPPVVLRVSAPRGPCYKLNARLGFKHAAKMMVQSGYTGFYLEVLQIGAVCAGDPISVSAGARAVRLDEQHRLNTRAAAF